MTIDLQACGLGVFADPERAQTASAHDLQRLQQAMVSLLLKLSTDCDAATDRTVERRSKEAFDRAYKTSTVVMNLLKSEMEGAR